MSLKGGWFPWKPERPGSERVGLSETAALDEAAAALLSVTTGRWTFWAELCPVVLRLTSNAFKVGFS